MSRGAVRPLRVLFVGKSHLPHMGGAEVSTHHLAAALDARGHAVTVVTRASRRSVTGLFDTFVRTTTGRTVSRADSELGYPTVRAVRPLESLRPTLDTFGPDAVVVTGTDPAFALEALDKSRGFPTMLYVRDVASASVARDATHVDLVVANSESVANSVRRHGPDAVFLPSLFPSGDYEVLTTREKVLFVNPSPRKGVDVALELARARRDIPFVFSLSWRMRASALRALRRAARRLGNVEIRKATTEPRALFRDCRLVIVPTQVPEAWCRVVSEAQISGIPSLASRLGGLPESVGPGGILVAPSDSSEAWMEALSEVWDDQERYEELSERALQHSRRPELFVDNVIQRFEELVARAIDRHSRCD
jgi:glycosyltransferase involved in cell wall biosynthesis